MIELGTEEPDRALAGRRPLLSGSAPGGTATRRVPGTVGRLSAVAGQRALWLAQPSGLAGIEEKPLGRCVLTGVLGKLPHLRRTSLVHKSRAGARAVYSCTCAWCAAEGISKPDVISSAVCMTSASTRPLEPAHGAQTIQQAPSSCAKNGNAHGKTPGGCIRGAKRQCTLRQHLERSPPTAKGARCLELCNARSCTRVRNVDAMCPMPPPATDNRYPWDTTTR